MNKNYLEKQLVNEITRIETLSQYTYRVDKNNKRIFEYDIVKGDSGSLGFVEFD